MSITNFFNSPAPPVSGFVLGLHMADFDRASLSEGEKAFFRSLNELGVPYMLVGMSAALLQGARGATEDLDLFFENLADHRIGEAAQRAGGFWVTRSEPPMLGGMSERFDVVTHLSGLPDFANEYKDAKRIEIDGVPVPVLPLARIIVSKRAANRVKDRATLEALELALKVMQRVE